MNAENALKILKDVVNASYEGNAIKINLKDGTLEKEELKV